MRLIEFCAFAFLGYQVFSFFKYLLDSDSESYERDQKLEDRIFELEVELRDIKKTLSEEGRGYYNI